MQSGDTGVYVGCMWAHEFATSLATLGISDTSAAASTGNTAPFLVGRVSYSFGLTGPCVSTDTACSSSLLAAHLACSGEFCVAFTALLVAFSLIFTPVLDVGHCLRADYKCKAMLHSSAHNSESRVLLCLQGSGSRSAALRLLAASTACFLPSQRSKSAAFRYVSNR